jgi:trk system potassium uptake protein
MTLPAQSVAVRVPHPGVVIVLMALVGTALLKLPICAGPGVSVTWLDAVFLSVAASCTTGLSVREPATSLSPWGLAVLISLSQIGAIVTLALGDWALSDNPSRGVRWRRTIALVLGIQAIAALAMIPLWPGDVSWQQRISQSVFLAVSALCNVGFSPMPGSMETLRYSAIAHLIVVPLILIGSLGLPVITALWNALRGGTGHAQATTSALPQRARLALAATLGLYLLGTIAITLGQLAPQIYPMLKLGIEGRNPPPAMSAALVGGAIADASFLSIASRPTGFMTVPVDQLQPSTRWVLVPLMFIGGVPGSAAGGVGVTTILVLLMAARGASQSNNPTAPRHDSSSNSTALRAAIRIVLSQTLLILLATWLLTLSEPFPLEKLLFETVSAASSAGLSLGITGSLTSAGKVVLILTMILGRCIPLAVLIRSITNERS